MRKLVRAALAATLAGVMAIPLPAAAGSADLAYGERTHVAQYYPRYRPYRPYRPYYRPGIGVGVGAGTVGLGVGTAIGRGIERSLDNDHIDRCLARYRSYNPETDTYLGYDGEYHRCRL